MGNSVLLQTKFLIPQQSANHLTRDDIIARIHQLDKPCTLLVAPAGYGKTTLLVDIANQTERRVTWIQLDEGDNDPATFMAYLIEGLNRQIEGLSIAGNLDVEDGILPDRMMVILLNQLIEIQQVKVLLILEDYHVIYNPIVHQLVATFVENLPPNVRVMIASRITPVLPLSRWRVRQQLLELRTETLRFSKAEAQNWLEQQAIKLTDASVEKLVDKTEGWGAGLQLATTLFTRQSDNDAVVNQLTGTQPYIFDYLVEEVFSRQSSDIQTFLLQSSVFTELNPATCEAVLAIEGVAEILERLEKNGLFISRLDYERHWYRYHELFRDFLLNKFKQQTPARYVEVQARAGDFYAQQGQSEIAVSYYLNAGDEESAIEMLNTFAWSYLSQGRVAEIQSYVNELSPNTRKTSPEVQYIQSLILRFNGHFTAAMEQLESVISSTQDARLLCQAYRELSAICHLQGNYQRAYELAQDAVKYGEALDVAEFVPALMQLAWCAGFLDGMDRGHHLAREAYRIMRVNRHQFADYGRARVLHVLGQICWWHGDVQNAIRYCQRALTLLGEADTPLKAQLLITLSSPELYQKNYAEALKLAEEAIRICQDLQLQEILPAAYAVLGNVLTRTGEVERAETCLRTAINRADSIGGARYAQVMAAGYLAQNLSLQGHIKEANRVASQALEMQGTDTLVYDAYVCQSVLADTYLDMNDMDSARSIYTHLIEVGEMTQYQIPLAMAYFGLAYIQMKQGQQQDALANAQKSLALLEPTRMYQLYLDQRERALLLCEQLVTQIPENTFVQQVYQSLSEGEKTPSIVVKSSGRIRVDALGQMRVFRDDEEIEPRAFASAKARDVLAYFVNLRTRSASLDRVVYALWPHDDGSTSAFHTALYRVRVALRREGEKEKFILSEVGEYRLDTSKFDIDVDLFETLLKHARQETNHAESANLYERALGLYRGDYLDNLYYEWVTVERERLEHEYIKAIGAYSALLLKDEQFQLAATWQAKALDIEPYNETLHIAYMETLARLGNQQKVTKHYKHMEALLLEAFGAEPLPETQAKYQQLLNT